MQDMDNMSDAEVQSLFFRAIGEFNTAVETLRKSMVMFPQDVVTSNYTYLREALNTLEDVQIELVRRMVIEQRQERRRILGYDPELGE